MDPAMEFEVRGLSRQKALSEAIDRGDSQIQAFYAGTTLFVTGFSGFLGKQLVEKLLRSCPKINKAYVLLREKKGIDIHTRLQKVLEDPVFQTLRKKQPKFAQKLVPVLGDTSELRLGISETDRHTITKEVNVIFHAAATTRFDDYLKIATNTNLRGTRELVYLAKECKNLQSLVYVSTAYSGATEDLIDSEVYEKFYGSPVDPTALIDLVNSMNEDVLNAITPNLIKGWPNTYTFTKRIAEEMVRRLSDGLPICLIRPTIVISTFSDPVPGWIEPSCAYGASGTMIGSGLGLIHVLIADHRCTIDLVPADMVNNLNIVAGWETARRFREGDMETRIYTLSSSARNAFMFGDIKRTILSLPPSLQCPSKAVYYIFHTETPYKPVAYFLYWLLHFIPGYFVDAILWIMGKKPILNKVYTKAWKLSTVLSYFLTNQWTFKDDNTVRLFNQLSPTDKEIYNCDVSSFEWSEMFRIWILGVRKYILMDDFKDFDSGVKKQYYLRFVHYAVVAVYAWMWWKVLGFCFWILTTIFRF